MHNGCLLIVILNLLASFAYGQAFYDSLKTEADRPYNCSFDYYNIDSLNRVFFETKNVKMFIDSSTNYQVLFSDSTSWCSGPNCFYHLFSSDMLAETEETHNRESLTQFNIPRKKHYQHSKTYTGIELIKNTELNANDTFLSKFPIVQNNTDNYNHKWTVFSNEKYLIFRFVSVYIGNTSHYTEKLIYLKKIE